MRPQLAVNPYMLSPRKQEQLVKCLLDAVGRQGLPIRLERRGCD